MTQYNTHTKYLLKHPLMRAEGANFRNTTAPFIGPHLMAPSKAAYLGTSATSSYKNVRTRALQYCGQSKNKDETKPNKDKKRKTMAILNNQNLSNSPTIDKATHAMLQYCI
jgi:hypothetical protein